MDLTAIPIVDHHAHPLLRPEATRTASAFQQWLSESDDPDIHRQHVPHSLFLRTGVRWLAELLGCEANLDAVVEARAAQSYHHWVTRLMRDANIDLLLCDYGYGGDDAYRHAEMQALLPCTVRPILRLETLAQELIVAHETFPQMHAAYLATVGTARQAGYVALKSIVAYRTGLAVAPVSQQDAETAFASVRQALGDRSGVRLASKPLCDYLLWQALGLAAEQGLPVQFHTGFGDREADLLKTNPLLLRSLIESTKARVVLLHAGWPYYREAAHLAALYGNVWLDLSLAIPLATVGIPALMRDVFGMAPFSKVLFATDAFTMPEIFWLAARWGRWGLGRVLDELVADGFLRPDEAWQAAVAVLGQNARALYMV